MAAKECNMQAMKQLMKVLAISRAGPHTGHGKHVCTQECAACNWRGRGMNNLAFEAIAMWMDRFQHKFNAEALIDHGPPQPGMLKISRNFF